MNDSVAGTDMKPVFWINNKHSIYKDSTKVVYNFLVWRNSEDSAAIYKYFNRDEVHQIKCDGFDFYLLPGLVVKGCQVLKL